MVADMTRNPPAAKNAIAKSPSSSLSPLPLNLIMIPARGVAIIEAIPWKSRDSPNAFVSFAKPSRSTIIIVLNDAKQAEMAKKCEINF